MHRTWSTLTLQSNLVGWGGECLHYPLLSPFPRRPSKRKLTQVAKLRLSFCFAALEPFTSPLHCATFQTDPKIDGFQGSFQNHTKSVMDLEYHMTSSAHFTKEETQRDNQCPAVGRLVARKCSHCMSQNLWKKNNSFISQMFC